MTAAIAFVRLISVDAEALARFYENALGFERVGGTDQPDDPFSGPLGCCVFLRLGEQHIQIAELVSGARPVETARRIGVAFQHFAMVAPVMADAMAQLEAVPGWHPISPSPQVLPPSSGGVTAFKFRDPEGHPLEFLTFPAGETPPRWQGSKGVLAGIDHTAIVIRDTAASAAFYSQLGFERTGGSRNKGAPQGRLDGLTDPVVEVTALAVPGAPPPHLELLRYQHPPESCWRPPDGSVLATRTVLSASGQTAGIEDPDGHRWIVAATTMVPKRGSPRGGLPD